MKKFTLGIIPQKPVEIRYQKEWFNYLVNNLSNLELSNEINIKIIYDENLLKTESKTNTSDFFDNLIDNIKWDSKQIELIFEKLNEYDALLFSDISFTGLFTSIIPLLKLGNPQVKLYGFCHATSLNKNDIFKNTRKIKWVLEKYVIENFEKIFVSTEYHKDKLVRTGNLSKKLHDKIIVTYGLPISNELFEIQQRRSVERSNTVILPSRINKQKLSHYKKEKLKKMLNSKNLQLIESYTVCNNRNDYYNLIENSLAMVVISNEDTFGYPLAEATAAGLPCFANKKCCYPEILESESLFDTFEELIEKLERRNYDNYTYKVKEKYIMKHEEFWNLLINMIKN